MKPPEPAARDGQPWPLAFFSEPQRLWHRALSLPQVLRVASETRVGTTPSEVVLQRHTHKLLRYRRDTPAKYAEPVLFCYALINRHYILDLQPDKSVVRQYLDAGYDVYLIDWGVPSDADRGLSLEHYVCGFLAEVVEHILREHERESLHLLGYCMGGTMSVLFTALSPRSVKTLTLLAAPLEFGGRESLLNIWSDVRHFDVDGFIAAHGNCPAWFLQICFLHVRPIQNYLEKNIAFYEQMVDPRFLSNYFAMETWLNDNIPMAGATFRQFVKNLYQQNELVRGQFHVGERRIELARVSCPLLLLTAKNDHLVPPSSTEGIRPHVASADIKSMTTDAGHVGLVVGGRAHKVLWPEATRWLAERSQPAAPSPHESDYANATD